MGANGLDQIWEARFADARFSQVGERERYTSVMSSNITAAGGARAATVDRRLGADSPVGQDVPELLRQAGAAQFLEEQFDPSERQGIRRCGQGA